MVSIVLNLLQSPSDLLSRVFFFFLYIKKVFPFVSYDRPKLGKKSFTLEISSMRQGKKSLEEEVSGDGVSTPRTESSPVLEETHLTPE